MTKKMKIYDYDNKEVIIELPDKEIKEVFVNVLSGDETGEVEFVDGTTIDFDASKERIMDFCDGYYTVSGGDIEKWFNYVPSGKGTISYERQNKFDFMED